MNYLAHAYLSFSIPEITVGNLISDFVKGKQQFEYSPAIRQGITLHRAIDSFTDIHPVTRRAKTFFKDEYGPYSGPLVDIVYDHFLALDPLLFPTTGNGPGDGGATALKAFAQQTYDYIASLQSVLPERFARIFYYMRTQDWLFHYRNKEGIFNSFGGLARRAAYMKGPEQACRLFEAHYADLQACYADFFPFLQEFALRTLKEGKIG
jgi:acyl carrier protein phosphodiesterase